jgi:(p)ppGpp synthase/HD superfamily hydrolase
MDSYKKHLVAMRYWLLGRHFYTAADALEFAAGFHTGLRKDGVTREYAHQLFIGRYVKSIADSLQEPEVTLAVAFLHDVSEDHGVSHDEIERRFGVEVAEPVRRLTKQYRSNRVPDEAYYAAIADHPVASVAKGADRVHNVQSMVGVFTEAKQRAYIEETTALVLPMLKTARRAFPQQEPAYENIQIVLAAQLQLLQAVLANGAANGGVPSMKE